MRKILAVLALVLAGLTPVALPSSTLPAAHADTACGQSTWDQLNSNGVPYPMTFNGWGDCAAAPNSQGFAKWSAWQYPLTCSYQDSYTGPAFKFVYVTNAGNPKTPLIDSDMSQVQNHIKRAVSVFAASENRGVGNLNELALLHTPRIITDSNCKAAFARVTVPAAVMAREPYINWTNPSTGQVEQGLWPYLETHGYPATANRRYIAVTDTAVGSMAPGTAGQTQAPYIGGDNYGLLDTQPGPQNKNNAGGQWMLIQTNGNASTVFNMGGNGSFGEVLAHEWTHSAGGISTAAPNYNALNPAGKHPSDCADILCYQTAPTPGQHYNVCGPAGSDTYTAYINSEANLSRSAFRLDCNRDDYWGYYQNSGIQEKAWVTTRWAAEKNRFFGGPDGYTGPVWNNQNYPIAP